MKFSYAYRTRDNVVHEDVIDAPSRDAAYRRLKAKGIKPSNMVLAPGVMNRIVALGKRWLAIFALVIVTIIAIVWAMRDEKSLSEASEKEALSLPRHTVASAPQDWRQQLPRYFPESSDLFFVRFAQPGVLFEEKGAPSSIVAVSLGDGTMTYPKVSSQDPGWVVEFKRIVIGMKDYAVKMRKAGKSDAEISLWLSERQRMEYDYRQQLILRVKRGTLAPNEANRLLHAMGLPTIPHPE